jgi:hypothetical protein
MEFMKTSQLLTNFFFAHSLLKDALQAGNTANIKSAAKEIADISEEIDLRIAPRMIQKS